MDGVGLMGFYPSVLNSVGHNTKQEDGHMGRRFVGRRGTEGVQGDRVRLRVNNVLYMNMKLLKNEF